MPTLTIHVSDILYNRLVAYSRDEAGTTPEQAAHDLLEEFLAEDNERDPETGEPLYDSDDGHLFNPDWLNEMVSARFVERDYGKQPGTVRSYLRYHPELKDTGDFRKEGHDWLVRREAAMRIWGSKPKVTVLPNEELKTLLAQMRNLGRNFTGNLDDETVLTEIERAIPNYADLIIHEQRTLRHHFLAGVQERGE